MNEKLIALTFDDGPNTVTTPVVLDILEKHGVKGTFFLVGNNITQESAKVSERAVRMGCELANHSKTHSVMTEMSFEEIEAEIAYTNERVKAISGEYPRFFRPPYIAVNDEMYKAVKLPFICGYGCCDWEADVSAEQRVSRTLEQSRHGALILLHDMAGNEKTAEAVDIIIPKLIEDGYELVTVSEMFDRCGVVPQENKIYSCVFD